MGLGGGGGGGGCDCSGGRVMVLVVVVVVVMVVTVVVSPVAAQTQEVAHGRFQMHASCGSEALLRNLVANEQMWVRTDDEEATLFTSSSNWTCSLKPHITHLVTVRLFLKILEAGATDEEGWEEGIEEGKKVVCFFPKQDVKLRRGVLKVSCLKEKDEAEAEMLGVQESPASVTTKDFLVTTLVTSTTSPASSATPSAGSGTNPASGTRPLAGRNLGLTSSRDAMEPTPTAAGPRDARQPPKSPATTEGATSYTETSEKTTTTLTETTTTSATHLPVTDDTVTMTMPGREVTETSAGTSESPGLVTETEARTKGLPDRVTPTTPGGNGSQESGSHKEDIKKENISAPETVMLRNSPQTNGDISKVPDDQMVYLAGGGAGVLALVLTVVVVASVAHHRRRQQAKAAAQQDELFMSGVYKGSMHNLTSPGSGKESGAYLNAHVMYYSGADPEMAESFELEERMLSYSGISYSSHDIPKCLK